MAERRGIVVETEGKSCIVLTPAGEFRRVPLAGRRVRLGEELALPEPAAKSRAALRPWLLAACLFLAAVVGLWYPLRPAVAYWVSLDLNPSLELGVNGRGQVIKVVAFDAAAEELLAGQKLKGQDAQQAVVDLLRRAAAMGFLAEAEAVVVLTVAGGEKDLAGEETKLRQAVEATLAQLAPTSQVVATTLDPAAHAAARQLGLSAGRYAIWQALKQSGISLAPSELKAKNLGQIARENKKDLRALLGQPRALAPQNPPSSAADENRSGPPAPPGTPSGQGQADSRSSAVGSKEGFPGQGRSEPIGPRDPSAGPKKQGSATSFPGKGAVAPGSAEKKEKTALPAAPENAATAGPAPKAETPAPSGQRQPERPVEEKGKREKEKTPARQKVDSGRPQAKGVEEKRP